MGKGAEPAAWQPIRAAARPEGRGSPGAQGAGLRLTVAVAGQRSPGTASAARRGAGSTGGGGCVFSMLNF